MTGVERPEDWVPVRSRPYQQGVEWKRSILPLDLEAAYGCAVEVDDDYVWMRWTFDAADGDQVTCWKTYGCAPTFALKWFRGGALILGLAGEPTKYGIDYENDTFSFVLETGVCFAVKVWPSIIVGVVD